MNSIRCYYNNDSTSIKATYKDMPDVFHALNHIRLTARKVMCTTSAEHVLYAIEHYSADDDTLTEVTLYTKPLELTDSELDAYIAKYPRAVFRALHKDTHQKACRLLEEQARNRKIIPLNLKEANSFVELHHRHNGPTTGYKFAIGLKEGRELIGVAICGRPVSRHLDNGEILEINRVCTTKGDNSCSMLYGACCRIAKEMGYRKIITYTRQSESGISLKASNFTNEGTAGGLAWSGKRYNNKPQRLKQGEMKIRWSKTLSV